MKIANNLKKLLSVALTLAMVLTMSGLTVIQTYAADETVSPAEGITSNDIVILYDNDVHCAVDGYASAAALKKEVQAKTSNVAMVSCGDFVQGGTLGALSKGESIIEIMNAVGYDIVTLGNHEFDYQIPQLKVLMKELKAKVVSCNFRYSGTDQPVYNGYIMKKYGDKKVAYVGITTPESFTKSTPAYFQNKAGKYLYTFCNDAKGTALYQRVQKTVNLARKNGADYVIAVSHLGNEGTTARWTAKAVAQNTYGIDVMLDGHSHETDASEVYTNQKGKNVLYSQTGTQFANIGKLVITADGSISTSLVSLKDYTKQDEKVATVIQEKKDEFAKLTEQVIGKTSVNLTTKNVTTGDRVVRSGECNMGDFCADAIRSYFNADVAIMNGGGIRADLPVGDITYGDLIAIFPWSNMGCMISATGQQIKDALEMGARSYPEECGGFLQVSGMKYTIDSSVPSGVEVDEKGNFVKVSGKYRVSNVKIYNKSTKTYTALKLNKTYQLAGINYMLKSGGDGLNMFKTCKILKDETVVDNEMLITYVQKTLGGTIGSKYANEAGLGRITIK